MNCGSAGAIPAPLSLPGIHRGLFGAGAGDAPGSPRGRTGFWWVPELGTGRSCWICCQQTPVCQSSSVPVTCLLMDQPGWECSSANTLEWGSILESMGLSASRDGLRVTGQPQEEAGWGLVKGVEGSGSRRGERQTPGCPLQKDLLIPKFRPSSHKSRAKSHSFASSS